ncbi:MAG: protein kinase family protein [Ruminococcaceae bacterium]|nr:protein kinase family protein [Oscillospiraceae bacterium]
MGMDSYDSNHKDEKKVDIGKEPEKGSTPPRKATEVDEVWRGGKPSTPQRKATEVDEVWRGDKPSTPQRKATEVDEVWRGDKPSTPQRKATEVDENWRAERDRIMDEADANFFEKIDDFKDAVVKLKSLTTSEGRVYNIKSVISREGGESVVLLCTSPEGKDFAAKVYFKPVNSQATSSDSRSRVLEYMDSEEGRKYTLSVLEIGTTEFGNSKYYFEITPFCKDGDVSDDGAFSFEELVNFIRQMNEVLHSLHENKILHRDIKPSNIFKVDGRYVLGDFGTAKVVENTDIFYHTDMLVRTYGYEAPEIYRGIYSIKTDYYAFGITIASLYHGFFIYDNMTEAMQDSCATTGKIPFRRNEENRDFVENLVDGLCQVDQGHRFTYEDVNKWLEDYNYTVNINASFVQGAKWRRPFRFMGEEYKDARSMFDGFTQDKDHWAAAMALLYKKEIEQFFLTVEPSLARAAQLAEEGYRSGNTDMGLAVFLKALLPTGPIVWKGHTFRSLKELGSKMVATKTPAGYGEILRSGVVSHWMENTEGVSVSFDNIKAVKQIEACSVNNPQVACYWFGNTFAEKKSLAICGKTVSDISSLVGAMFDSAAVFYQGDGYEKLVSMKDGADLYGFLYSFGFKELCESVWSSFAKVDLFHKTAMLFSMMDNIAVKSDVNPDKIRQFFVNYGPVGIATYTRELCCAAEEGVYAPLDSEGRQLLNKIKGFKAPAGGNVDELFRAYAPLIDSVDSLSKRVIDNPHCVLAGVYENKGVICKNLKGTFAFRIFDAVAPLGFNHHIESAKGGNA